jgi:hypothetical protein
LSETNTNTNSNNNTNTNNNKSQNDNNAWLENLKKNEDQRNRQKQWFNLQPGEKAVVEFLPEFGPVWKDFDNDGKAETLRYEYKVIDINHKEDGPKPWDLSKTWSQSIDYFLKEGHRILKVERVGSGMKTQYHFSPVQTPTATTPPSS